MNLNANSYSRSPGILIAEQEPSMLEMLPQALQQRMPAMKLDVCSSRDHGMEKLRTSQYRLVISGVHLTELDNFLLLKRTRLLQKNAPLVITAGQVETASVRHALRQGAFDYISSPLDLIQMVHTVRIALWYSQIQHLIAFHRYALERYYVHMVTDPEDKEHGEILMQGVVAVDKSFEAAEETVTRMQRAVEDFDHIAVDVESQAKQEALERLDTLLKTRASVPFEPDDPFR